MQPLNGYIQVEVLEDNGFLTTVIDEFSPQKVKVVAISLPWQEGETSNFVDPSIKGGSVLLVERIFNIKLGSKEYVFIRNSQIIAILDNDETSLGT